MARACWWLTPLYDLVVSTVLSSPKVFADDTTLPVLDPGRGRTKTGRLWCYAVDDRPWCGPTHPAAAYIYAEDRKNDAPGRASGRSFDGVLQVDGYDGFKRLAGDRADVGAAGILLGRTCGGPSTSSTSRRSRRSRPRCWRVSRASTRSRPRSAAIPPSTDDRFVRSEVGRSSRPCMTGCRIQLTRVSGASDLAKAMRYAIRHWPGLIAFLDDGRIEMDTNMVERAIRPHTLTRKNALFAGSDGGARHWAIAMTLIQTAKLNGVEPMAWLTDVLERIVSGRTKANQLHTLLPWNWTPPNSGIVTQLAA